MNEALKVVRLHLNKPQLMFLNPLAVFAAVILISAVIVLVLQRVVDDQAATVVLANSNYNSGMFWGLSGFLIYFGVQAVATTVPLTLALGSSRRAHVLGTALANLLLAAYIATVLTLLLFVERATGYWFVGVRVIDVGVSGGDPLSVWVFNFASSFLFASMGGLFAAVWRRFGAVGSFLLAAGIVLVGVTSLLLFLPQLGDLFSNPVAFWVLLMVLGLLAMVGSWFALRRAPVR